MTTVVSDLTALFKLTPNADDTPQTFSKRLVKKATEASDDDWGTLEDPTQKWVTAAALAINAKKPFDLPLGIEVVFPEVAEAEEAPVPAKKVALKKKPPQMKTVRRVSKRFETSDRITLVAEGNPYRPNTHSYGWFAAYKNGMTVAEAVEAGTPRHHIRWDFTKGNITIAP